MGLKDHAEYELRRAGLFDKDSDYDGMLGPAVVEMVEVFAKQGHSGFSAGYALALFDKVARFKTLTPLTSDPAEWNDVSDQMGRPCWQNKRDSSVFSEDGGKTWKASSDHQSKLDSRVEAVLTVVVRLLGESPGLLRDDEWNTVKGEAEGLLREAAGDSH